MNFEFANQCAERISKGENTGLFERLVSECTSYLLRLRIRFGFHQIHIQDVIHELAADAVTDSITDKKRGNLPFAICLCNAFRDVCRQRYRIIREHSKENIIAACDIKDPPPVIGVGPKRPSSEIQAQRNEEKEIFQKELENHEKFSKKVVYERMRCSTYKEMAEVFGETLNECKRVYWHNFNIIREKLRWRYVKDE